MLQTLKGLPTVTKSGKKVHLYANIGGVEDVDSVLENDSEGVGLFRSEFLYLGREDYPSEEEQYEAYKEVLSKMGGKKVIIRTLDIGADKQADYFNIEKEENNDNIPEMGLYNRQFILDNYSVSRMVQDYEDAYEKLLDKIFFVCYNSYAKWT